MKDNLVRATAADGGVSLVAVSTTETVNEARSRHSLSYLTTVILGRAMGAGLLLASSMKVQQGRVTIKFQSDGPLKGLFVDAGRDGTVRGYVGNPELELELINTSSAHPYFDFSTATGTGYLHITRDTGRGQPFSSTVELEGGGVGEDIASYLLNSEQTKSAVFVGEKIENGKLISSGALIAQVLPKANSDNSLIDKLDQQCLNISQFSEHLYSCKDNLSNIFELLFPSLGSEVIHPVGNYQNISFKCRCSRSRSVSALRLLGKKELQDILQNEKESKLTCKFCNNKYIIGETELKQLINEF